jgi:hypothetical protein
MLMINSKEGASHPTIPEINHGFMGDLKKDKDHAHYGDHDGLELMSQ